MRMTASAIDGHPRSGMAHVVERNIRALLARRQAEDRRVGWQDRLADRITQFAQFIAVCSSAKTCEIGENLLSVSDPLSRLQEILIHVTFPRISW
jgi:hypothetical protein